MEECGLGKRESQRQQTLAGVGALTQGLEDAGHFLGCTDGLEILWQGWVVTRRGHEPLGLEAGVGQPLLL